MATGRGLTPHEFAGLLATSAHRVRPGGAARAGRLERLARHGTPRQPRGRLGPLFCSRVPAGCRMIIQARALARTPGPAQGAMIEPRLGKAEAGSRGISRLDATVWNRPARTGRRA
jgi:hypothetical protein